MPFQTPHKLIVETGATQDIEDILHYTQIQYGLNQAQQYQSDLYHSLLLIADNPEIGVKRQDLSPSCRSLPAGKHVILYNVSQDTIRILRILHQQMDITPSLFN